MDNSDMNSKRIEKVLADNINKLLGDHSYLNSNPKIAERTGLGTGTISRVRNADGSTKLETVEALSKAFGVTVTELLTEQGAPVRPASDALPSGYIRLQRLDVTAHGGAGGEPVATPDVIEHLDVLERWARDILGGNPSHLKIINFKGDSMAPTIPEGSIVFVDDSIRHFEAEGLYCIDWQGRLLVKRLRAKLDGRLEIGSDNQAAYSPEYVSQGEIDRLTICGRVKGWWNLQRF